jgi:hypothetical protein
MPPLDDSASPLAVRTFELAGRMADLNHVLLHLLERLDL